MPDQLRETYYMSWRADRRSTSEGWYIQIPFSRNGNRLVWRKLVSKHCYGGTKKSLKRIAIAMREEMMRKLGVHDPGLGIYHRQRSPRNASGLVGIRLTEEGKKGGGHFHWEARWRKADRKIARTAFSIARHGFDGAKRMAIAAREKGLRARVRAAKRSMPAEVARQHTQTELVAYDYASAR